MGGIIVFILFILLVLVLCYIYLYVDKIVYKKNIYKQIRLFKTDVKIPDEFNILDIKRICILSYNTNIIKNKKLVDIIKKHIPIGNYAILVNNVYKYDIIVCWLTVCREIEDNIIKNTYIDLNNNISLIKHPNIIESLIFINYVLKIDMSTHLLFYSKLYLKECVTLLLYPMPLNTLIENLIIKKYLSYIYQLEPPDKEVEYLYINNYITRRFLYFDIENIVVDKIPCNYINNKALSIIKYYNVTIICPTDYAPNNKYNIYEDNILNFISKISIYGESILNDDFSVYNSLNNLGNMNVLELEDDIMLVIRFMQSDSYDISSYTYIDNHSNYRSIVYIDNKKITYPKFFVLKVIYSDVKIDINIIDVNRKFFVCGTFIESFTHDIKLKYVYYNNIHIYLFYINIYHNNRITNIVYDIGKIESPILNSSIKNKYNSMDILHINDIYVDNNHLVI